MNRVLIFLLTVFFLNTYSAYTQQTEIRYLSGTGSDHTIEWDFFCTAGRNAGKWTKIAVPSNWELQGFGTYNYGHDKDEDRGKETGLYRYSFQVPKAWNQKKVNIVFEGSMTDTHVKINGAEAGKLHQGSFYRFKYDISRLLKYGSENLLEVSVAKHSANEGVNEAERRCDFWIFGGIFRPVYLEALPEAHIERMALDAKADGTFKADVYLNNISRKMQVKAQVRELDGTPVGTPITVSADKNSLVVHLETTLSNVRLWSPEYPNRYQVDVQLTDGKPVHEVTEKFGFRTVELRESDGIYVNGTKVMFKGVCRHSFRPNTGRTLSKQVSIEDVNTIKDMNMNAVRMSHYPPDVHFLDVCDSLGLFVLDELAGWQTAYDTPVGSLLAQEMLHRDVNHPSIVVWDNGNEGGWNKELDHFFDELDPQQRPLIHPWAEFRGTDTQHYKDYNYGTGTHQHGRNIVFPTEFLHGLYDGGHGAGLDDYWKLMLSNPLSAGGFLWDYADEAVVRTDLNGKLDTRGNLAADGILGPYLEKEGSYYTIKEIWSPVFMEQRYITPGFNGKFNIENRYLYTNLKDCRFSYRLVDLPGPDEKAEKEIGRADIPSPDLAPGQKGQLKMTIPSGLINSDVLTITATDPNGRAIYTWSWPIKRAKAIAEEIVKSNNTSSIKTDDQETLLNAQINGLSFTWDKRTGFLSAVKNNGRSISFIQGPRLAEGDAEFQQMKTSVDGQSQVVECFYKGNLKKVKWTVLPSGWLKLEVIYKAPYLHKFMGVSFDYPEDQVTGVRWMGEGPYRVWKNRMKGNTLNVWSKAYNNTVTGESWVYPEFKGYHRNFYWATIESKEQDFTIVCPDEEVYLRLFTPEKPRGASNDNTSPEFPAGNISFMHDINPIGTKFSKPESMGPNSLPNMFSSEKYLTLYFNFNKEEK